MWMDTDFDNVIPAEAGIQAFSLCRFLSDKPTGGILGAW